jgi:hypothetical protein
VGRATDLAPLSIPSIVLRKKTRQEGEPPSAGGIETNPFLPSISRPESGTKESVDTAAEEDGTEEDEYHVKEIDSQDPVSRP